MADPIEILDATSGTWQERTRYVAEMMREMSAQQEPDTMVRLYSARIQAASRMQRFISLSRRGVEAPRVVLARDNTWKRQPNVWTERASLPVYDGGFLSEIAYAGEVRVEQDLRLAPGDPAKELLANVRSALALPIFDGGEARNVLLLGHERPHMVDPATVPQTLWFTNLFARATHNLVTARQLRDALDALDREMKLVADVQRALLPPALPPIPGLEIDVHYQPARDAGGDYYDFFPLGDGRWGILLADVSGHGTPAAVEMAITRTLAHVGSAQATEPRDLLAYVNDQLCLRRSTPTGSFVTAFLGAYDPRARTLRYALAGHPPPRLKRCGSGGRLEDLGEPTGLPLGVMPGQPYRESERGLDVGDLLVAYTDGITEAADRNRALFGTARLDASLKGCGTSVREVKASVLASLRQHVDDRPFDDDVTMVVARAVP